MYVDSLHYPICTKTELANIILWKSVNMYRERRDHKEQVFCIAASK
jgi:hypothetical protein